MAFTESLISRVAGGVNRRTQQMENREQKQQGILDEIQRRKAMMPQQLEENQALFDQQQQQLDQAMPGQLARKETEMMGMADIQRKIAEVANSIPIQTSPGLREAVAAGDMAQIPLLVKNQGDVEFMNTIKRAVQNTARTPEYYGQKQEAIEKAKAKHRKPEKPVVSPYEREKQRIKARQESGTLKTGKLSDVQKAELRTLRNRSKRLSDSIDRIEDKPSHRKTPKDETKLQELTKQRQEIDDKIDKFTVAEKPAKKRKTSKVAIDYIAELRRINKSYSKK